MTAEAEHSGLRLAVAAGPDGQRMRALAERLAVPLAPVPSTDIDWLLIDTDGGLALVDTQHTRIKPLRIELGRQLGPIGRREPLRRAVGRGVTTAVDATAGLGGDTALLLAMGLEVLAIERSVVIAVLFEDALRRAAGSTGIRNLRFVHGDSCAVLAGLSVAPDVVFIDPMYPGGRKRSVLPRKECRMLRALVGADADAATLFAAARRTARRRVVVKRPLYAPPLAPGPAATHRGKQVRYDVYVISKQ